jgi:signal transduction histidine kinase
MPPGGETERGESLGGDQRGRLEGQRKARSWAPLQGGILFALALVATGLQHRASVLDQTRDLEQRGRSLAEMVAHAIGPKISDDSSSRVARIFPTAIRDGHLIAGAVLDAEDTIVAHTNPERVGAPASPDLDTALFGEADGRVFSHPVVGPDGRSGTVTLLVPGSPAAASAATWRLLLTPGLILLAWLATNRIAVRQLLAPTRDSLRRLTRALDRAPEEGEPPPSEVAESALAMDGLVSRVEALRESEHELTVRNQILSYRKERMELILHRFPDGLIVADPARNVIFANPASVRALGMAAADLVGTNLRECPPALGQLIDVADRSGRAVVPAELAGPDRHLSLTRAPLMASGNQAVGTLYTLRDVTAQQASQRAQAEFLSQVTHELKAPLHTIVAYVEELADDEGLTREERRDYSNTLDAEVNRMAQLISNLLQLSRIQLGNLSAQRGFVKPSSLIADQAASQRAAAEDRQLELETSIPENLPALYGDKDLLGVAITNLLTNAIKYTRPGGHVRVAASATPGGVSVEISDTGVGVPKEEQARIFERFARSEQDWVQEQSGSGLGLSLVKEIVEIHEGQISVESEVGKGSCFRISLPCREAGTRPDVVESLT